MEKENGTPVLDTSLKGEVPLLDVVEKNGENFTRHSDDEAQTGSNLAEESTPDKIERVVRLPKCSHFLTSVENYMNRWHEFKLKVIKMDELEDGGDKSIRIAAIRYTRLNLENVNLDGVIMELLSAHSSIGLYEPKGPARVVLPVVKNALKVPKALDVPDAVKQVLSWGEDNFPKISISALLYGSTLCKVSETNIRIINAEFYSSAVFLTRIVVMKSIYSVLASETSFSFRKIVHLLLEQSLIFFQSLNNFVVTESVDGKHTFMISKKVFEGKQDAHINQLIEMGTCTKIKRLTEHFSKINEEFTELVKKIEEVMDELPFDKDQDKALPFLLGTYEVNGSLHELIRYLPIWNASNWYVHPLEELLVKTLRKRFEPHFKLPDVENIVLLAHTFRALPCEPLYELMRCDFVSLSKDIGCKEAYDAFAFWISKYKALRNENYLDMPLPEDLLLEIASFVFKYAKYFSYNNEVYLLDDKPLKLLSESTFWSNLWFERKMIDNPLIFTNFGVKKAWKSNDSLLVLIEKKYIKNFQGILRNTLHTSVNFETECLGEKGYPSILFSNLRINNRNGEYLVQIEKDPNQSQRMMHYLSLHNLSEKQRELERIIWDVLLTTSNEFLLDDLFYCKEQFLNNSYSPVLVGQIFREIILEYLEILRDPSSFLPLTENGRFERRHALKFFLSRFQNVELDFDYNYKE